MSTKDEDIEALLGKRKISPPKFMCGSGHRVERFCSNETCESDALCCSVEGCQICDGKHENCLFSSLSQLTSKLENKVSVHNNLIRTMLKIDGDLMI
jgi:hypothetical protein